jgi:hypothetical protein
MADEQNSGALVGAAKVIGKVAGKIAAATVGAPAPAEPPKKKENLYKAEYIGSGTFLITKPKRKSPKLRQTRLKGRVRGART